MKKVNELVICKDEYETEEEFNKDINSAIMLLLKNDYFMTVRYDDKELGIVVIEYDYRDRELCDYIPMWVDTNKYGTHIDVEYK